MAKQPQYRLQVLFEMRERAKKDKEEAYAAKQKELAAEQRTLADMKDKLVQMGRAREARRQEYSDRTAQGEYTIQQINANDRQIKKMKDQEAAFQVQIDRQGERVVEVSKEVQEALQEVVKATQDFKALEKHKEKFMKAARYAQMQAEESAAEDIAQAQYFQRILDEIGDSGD